MKKYFGPSGSQDCFANDVEFEGHAYTVSVGFDAAGAVKEVFVTGQHQGSTLDATLNDTAICISHHLQRGSNSRPVLEKYKCHQFPQPDSPSSGGHSPPGRDT